MSELLPCPWCGKQPDIHKHNQFYVCDHFDCDHFDGSGGYFGTEESAIEFWNTRYKGTCELKPFHSTSKIGEGDGFYCTSCNRYLTTSEGMGLTSVIFDFNYCPLCGAKVVRE